MGDYDVTTFETIYRKREKTWMVVMSTAAVVTRVSPNDVCKQRVRQDMRRGDGDIRSLIQGRYGPLEPERAQLYFQTDVQW